MAADSRPGRPRRSPSRPESPTVTPPGVLFRAACRTASATGDPGIGTWLRPAANARRPAGPHFRKCSSSLPAGSAEGRREAEAAPGPAGRSSARAWAPSLPASAARATASAASLSERASAEAPGPAGARRGGWSTARPAGSGCADAAARLGGVEFLGDLGGVRGLLGQRRGRLDQRRDRPVTTTSRTGGTYSGSAIRSADDRDVGEHEIRSAALRVRSPRPGSFHSVSR